MEDKKKCTKCCKELPSTDEYFYKQLIRDNVNGDYYILVNECKECAKERATKNRIKNAEKYRKTALDYYYENKDEVSQKKKIYYNENKDMFQDWTKQWRTENKQKIRQYNKKYSNKKHIITSKEWKNCKEYFNNCCAYCGISNEDSKKLYGQYLHKEHLIDCGKDNLKNCVPSCKICNSTKHTSSFNDWYNQDNPKYSRERYLKIYQWVRYDYKVYILPKDKEVRKQIIKKHVNIHSTKEVIK
jgi:hypothetical protein